ncbi:CD248 molecule, endosialin a [Chanos chanos]|uniref:CD248 molecule, endosialin a n=1 Tax=Chanos chanos TaxID=29144 RepID=A0A6J2VX64_CHACN|nr:endosialin-like [Chanos chanos]
MIESLFSNMELRAHQSRLQVWIGLQRQPRQCSPNRPLRGFSWITGDQDTQYTNWLHDDSPSTCSFPRCVIMGYSTVSSELQDNFKWRDGPCSVPVDAYLCRFTYRGMCPAIRSEGGGNAFYSTPFNLLSTILTHVPIGTMAKVPCPMGTKEDQSVLCTQRSDGSVAWNRDAPLCTDIPKKSWCDQDNGGCLHDCVETETHHYCKCDEGYLLAEDGVSCFQTDPCQGSLCQYECLPVMGSYRCICPEGYMLMEDEHSCLDVDECLQSPCEQQCVNAPGTFECRCEAGYWLDEAGMCEDVDECTEEPCEHACENTPGSHICHCRLGFAPLGEDPSRCHDINECQIEGTCEHMCLNYDGGFECYCEEGYELMPNQYSCRLISGDQETPSATPPHPWITSNPDPMWDPQYPWLAKPNINWPSHSGTEQLDWLTDPPNVENLSTDLMSLTTASLEEAELTPDLKKPSQDAKDSWNIPDFREPEDEALVPPTTATPTPDYYDDESTMTATPPSTSTVGGGAWSWFWHTSSPSENEDSFTISADMDTEVDYYEETNTAFPQSHTPSLFITNQIPVQGIEEETSANESNWLLVALLVPLCIFILVLVVLGIIYCTRCNAQQRSNKSATDCYHWISGASDKAAADIDAGTKSHV